MGLDSKAAQVLGADVSHTAVVSPKGQGKRLMTAGAVRQAAGLAGMLAHDAVAAKSRPDAPGGFTGGYIVMALTADSVAFLTMKRGLLRNSVGELLDRVDRAEVSALTFGSGLTTVPLTVSLTDGTVWELEVPRANKRSAEKLVAAFMSA